MVELLNDAEIDVVYIGVNTVLAVRSLQHADLVLNTKLPNGLHYEWTMKALAAGKHVMCDKPIANNEDETRKMFALAQEKGLVLLETWQPQ